MLDIKEIRENADRINQALKRRKPELSVDEVLAIDVKRRELLQEEETLRSERNQLSKQVGQLKKNGEDASTVLEQSKKVAERIKAIEDEKDVLEQQQRAILLNTPNTPAAETPDGQDEHDNQLIKEWGKEYKIRPQAKVLNHWEIGEKQGFLDFERGVKIAKSRFSVFRGPGAQLARALTQFMLDTHTQQNGYEEILPPYLVNRDTMMGTGQLPKFEDDMFKIDGEELFLIPTAEVPVTNLYSGEILAESDLPMCFTAYTPCFRKEAGSAGRDTRGLIRQHQFDKVELVQIVQPEDSDEALEKLTRAAEGILEALELPYRRVALCAGDLGFSAARCNDLEVWMPAQGLYREISSCSNMRDFQARRMNLKYRCSQSGRPKLVHTLNGSGLAIGRTVAAILENYQVSDTQVAIPTVLQDYIRPRREFLRYDYEPTTAQSQNSQPVG